MLEFHRGKIFDRPVSSFKVFLILAFVILCVSMGNSNQNAEMLSILRISCPVFGLQKELDFCLSCTSWKSVTAWFSFSFSFTFVYFEITVSVSV